MDTTSSPTSGRDRRGIAVFLALAFGLAWLPFLAQLTGLLSTGAILMPIAPAIACFVVRKWVTREGFADAGLGLHLRHWPLYLLAVLWPVAAILVNVPLALAFHLAPHGFAMPWGMTTPRHQIRAHVDARLGHPRAHHLR